MTRQSIAVSIAGIWLGMLPTIGAQNDYLSPCALAASPDGRVLYVACATTPHVLFLDLASRKVSRAVEMPASPSGLAVSRDGARLYATCSAPSSVVSVVDTASGRIVNTIKSGHTATAPVLGKDGKTLFVCNRFDNDVSVIDLSAGKEVRRVKVGREPVAAALAKDGRFLLVANFLHTGRADEGDVAAVITVIDTVARTVVKELALPQGSGLLNDIRVSPDGRYAFITHVLARANMPTTQIERGWINTNAGTIIDLDQMTVLNTVLLDSVDLGAANPWGVAWSADGARLVVAHAGVHQISVIDFPALLGKLESLPATLDPAKGGDYTSASRIRSDVPNDLAFLVGIRRRISLPGTDLGPRAVAVVGEKAYAANYFTDTLTIADLSSDSASIESVPLGPRREMTLIRKGEFYFCDASICFQGWQSCSSCHPGEGRVDGLNWDLLNDGIGNPKNTKSLLLSHRTPPAMSLGKRDAAETAVRSGIRHILFTQQPEEVAVAMDAYLKALKPVPSPLLVNGKLSERARRGAKLYANSNVDCSSCHPQGLFTDLRHYDTGTAGPLDQGVTQFDTPTLIEVWRTAPYLHDGSAATVRDLLTIRNKDDRHGRTSHLTPQQIDDLVEYVLSL